MSLPTAKIVCTGCDYEAVELYRPVRICYKLNNGEEIETVRTKGWCYSCSSYSDIEDIDQEAFASQLAVKKQERLEACRRLEQLSHGFLSGLRHRSKKEQLQYCIEVLDDEISKLGKLLGMAKRRTSKARCLRCWSDNTVPLIFVTEDQVAHGFLHDCGGSLQKIDDLMGIRISFRVATYILNEEGGLLGTQ